jgi:uncharacterized membrane protein
VVDDNRLKLAHKLIVIVIIPVIIFSAVFEITFYRHKERTSLSYSLLTNSSSYALKICLQ